MHNKFKMLLLILIISVLSGCSKADSKASVSLQEIVALESGDECHLCGMIINNHPGPKGQLSERGRESKMKFCSTRDMFAYLLDPEHTHNIKTVYVHDMALNPWDTPSEETYIDGKKAWYVIGSSQKGAMGPTLASFSEQQSAKVFA
jgi:copper chaperone NosL